MSIKARSNLKEKNVDYGMQKACKTLISVTCSSNITSYLILYFFLNQIEMLYV